MSKSGVYDQQDEDLDYFYLVAPQSSEQSFLGVFVPTEEQKPVGESKGQA